MNQIINVTGGQGGNAFLLIGKEKTALIDCGMAYCEAQLISNIKHILSTRVLDYILISHSHYDHIGAIPYLKKVWPAARVLGAEYAQRVLQKPSALKTIRNLSMQAAAHFGAVEPRQYDDDSLKVDNTIADNDTLNLGDMHIKVIKTIGHTQCSLSFLVNNQTLFASETTGCMGRSGRIYPAFITSCKDAVDSIRICRQLKPQFVISPHYGLISETDTVSYWDNCLLAVRETQEFVLHLAALGYEEEHILVKYEKMFRDDQSRQEQPMSAFRLNAESMIKTVLREAQTDNLD